MIREENAFQHEQVRVYEYELPGEWTVLVGSTDADNDGLSLRVARPGDWWFHVRGVPGSHVILRARASEQPDRETLKRAAAIAAYHSKARNSGRVSVACTQARHVTKPKGAKPGTVQIRKEIIVKVVPVLPVGKKGTLVL
jgi:predicted ribosome quality control (RQC) complex YloA/Tae2 family protein